ncbi:MAG: M67 family metallopeptidase [Thermanaerothrix sp.]|uniref:M67 family metallopeptidase n=1 Tax=Thermanaerothrix solaris TaxID=3058434 RepID=A0ABU3NR13_9CHLR|nr:M67 family metallopeptidase [Thermanaerothrix sp. 4228-RoL]MDT8899272.1 M67 family metallopeptidase [Thermanaerothrix sp. 4228-RoL]
MERSLRLSAKQKAIILEHVVHCVPEEACGLLGGCGSIVKRIIPVTNRLHSPVRFYMEPTELLKALEALEEEGLELVGIFHSHPHGPAVPSETDLNEFAYPESLMVILSPQGKDWQLRAFEIDTEHHAFREVDVVIEKE